MIFKDSQGLPLDQTMDGGDSSMRAGVGSISGIFDPKICSSYEISLGWFVRHPTQSPTNNNKLNFTRDQLTPLVAGLSLTPEGQTAIRRGFWKSLLRLGFAQDFQRDKPGSWKLLWPNHYWKDSNPTTDNYPWPEKLSGANVEFSWLDFADPLGPAILWHMIVAGKIKRLYWLGILGVPFSVLSIVGYRLSGQTENNQIICQCFVQGKWAICLFKWINPNWKTHLEAYWSGRNEIEYAQAIEKLLES